MLNRSLVKKLGRNFLELVVTNQPFTGEGGFALHNRNMWSCVLLFTHILETQFQAAAHLCLFFTNDPRVNYLEVLPACVKHVRPLLSDECELQSNPAITL
jgi:hypothetical protein